MPANSTNGAHPEPSVADNIATMRQKGWEQTIPTTGRVICLRAVEPGELLMSDDCPDILTPLMLRSVYEELTDREIRAWLEQPLARKEDALAYLQMLDIICTKGIADGTPVSALTLGEKKFIFRFVLGPAEMLVLFRYQAPADVAPAPQGEGVPQAAE